MPLKMKRNISESFAESRERIKDYESRYSARQFDVQMKIVSEPYARRVKNRLSSNLHFLRVAPFGRTRGVYV